MTVWPSVEEWEEEAEEETAVDEVAEVYAELGVSARAEANISAEAMTRRSDEVKI